MHMLFISLDFGLSISAFLVLRCQQEISPYQAPEVSQLKNFTLISPPGEV